MWRGPGPTHFALSMSETVGIAVFLNDASPEGDPARFGCAVRLLSSEGFRRTRRATALR